MDEKQAGLLGSAGKMIGGVANKVLPWAWPALQAWFLYDNYTGRAAAAAKPPAQAKLGAPASGLDLSTLRQGLQLAPGGGVPHMASAITTLDTFQDRVLAFDWGAEQFCKSAGFDSDDTKVMLALLKEAAPRIRPSARAQTASMFPQLLKRFLPPEAAAQTEREMFGSMVPKRIFGPEAGSAPQVAPVAGALRAALVQRKARQRGVSL